MDDMTCITALPLDEILNDLVDSAKDAQVCEIALGRNFVENRAEISERLLANLGFIESIKAEIKRRVGSLKTVLMENGMPTHERLCECCGKPYMPGSMDSVRCGQCCLGCRYDRDTKAWIKGRSCPGGKEIAC